MDCADEAALVRRALGAAEGVRSVEFDLIHGFVDVSFDETATTEAALLTTIRSTGLHAHAVHGLLGHHAVAQEHDDASHQHTDSSTIAAWVSGGLFVAGFVVEGLGSGHWFEAFVHTPGVSHSVGSAGCYGFSAFAGLWPMWPRAFAALRHLRLDMHALVCLTVVGAAIIGEWSEGAAVAFLFALAHRLEAWSIDRARRAIALLVGRGAAVLGQGRQQSAPSERWIERFASFYTPAVAAAALVVAAVPPLVDGAWATWFYRALVFLVLACPCALVISTPVTMIAALSAAARRGVLVKGGAVLERAAKADPLALAAADITVAGSDAAHDAMAEADVVLTTAIEHDEATRTLVTIGRRAVAVVRQNVAISLATKAAFLISAPFGFAPLWMAVLADTGATVIVTLNALRLLRAGSA